jgi:hypothetical protein
MAASAFIHTRMIRPILIRFPSGALQVRNRANLLVAGGASPATHQAHGSTRVSGTAMATGEAAGTLAAPPSRRHGDVRSVPYDELASQLLRQGSVVGAVAAELPAAAMSQTGCSLNGSERSSPEEIDDTLC